MKCSIIYKVELLDTCLPLRFCDTKYIIFKDHVLFDQNCSHVAFDNVQ